MKVKMHSVKVKDGQSESKDAQCESEGWTV